jgi:hypothetical protein
MFLVQNYVPNQIFNKFNLIVFLTFANMIFGYLSAVLRNVWPNVILYLPEIKFVETEEQMWTCLVATFLFFYCVQCEIHLLKIYPSKSYNFLNYLLTFIKFNKESVALPYLTLKATNSLKKIYRILSIYYQILYWQYRSSCDVIILVSTCISALAQLSYFQVTTSILTGYSFYIIYKLFCFFYQHGFLIYLVSCFYFDKRFEFLISKIDQLNSRLKVRFCNRLNFKQSLDFHFTNKKHFIPRLSSFDQAAFIVEQNSLKKILSSIILAYRDFENTDLIVNKLAGGWSAVANLAGVFFYYFIFFKSDRIPNKLIYFGLIFINGFNTFGCTFLNNLVMLPVQNKVSKNF